MSTGAGIGTTAGAPSAADDARIRALRSRVYGPDASQADIAALAEALAAAAPPPPLLDEVAEAPPQAAPPSAPPAAAPVTRVLAALSRVPPRLLVAVVAVAALGALAGAGTAAVAAGTGSTAPRAAPRFTATVDVAAPAGVLSRPARSGDRPTALVGPDLVSFRHLAAYPAAGVTLWAARDRFGEACLVVADTYYRTACADAATVAKDGLVLAWSGGPGYPASTTESYTAVWRAGRLTVGRSAS